MGPLNYSPALQKRTTDDSLSVGSWLIGHLGDVRWPRAMHVAEHRQGDVAMQMRIIWGKILPGQWDAFEAAFKKALEIRGEVQGLKGQWLLRDQNDPDAGYSISQWESEADMQAFWDSPKRREAMAVLQPFFVNQFTVTHCTVRVASSY
jgi:heme-degrading monooxygenase HmoA